MPRLGLLILCALVAILHGPSTASAQLCGNGVVESGEECDDGNDYRLDGCTPDCSYEHVQQLTSFALAGGGAPSLCTPSTNAFGNAFSSTARDLVNDQLAAAIANGSVNQLVQILDLDDPTGVDDALLEVGLLSARPDARNGSLGLDSWQIAQEASLDPQSLPTTRLDGSLTSGELVAGPERIELDFLGGTLVLRDSLISALVDTPTSLPAPPPEELAAGFEAFEVLLADDSQHGLCGNVTIATLAAVPVPQDLASGGVQSCSSICPGSRQYNWCGDGNPVAPGCNSVLDLLVSGCSILFPLCIDIVDPQQPDVGTNGQPPLNLVPNLLSGEVPVIQPEDAYSTWLSLAGQRVHLTNNLGAIFIDGFESADTASWSAVTP